MKNILFAIILRFFAKNLDSIISTLTKLDTQLDTFIARQNNAFDQATADADAALARAQVASNELDRAARIQRRVKALTA